MSHLRRIDLVILTCVLTMICLSHHSAWAWGRRGHSISCQTAAYLTAAHQPGADFLRKHSFDLGYYCNVPDFVWKKGDLYQKESFNHFMDLEIFERAFAAIKPNTPTPSSAYAMSRTDFTKTYPHIEASAGRAFWRIRELADDLSRLRAELENKSLKTEDRHRLQLQWLITAGALGHYVADMVQPLHVTENYDGQLTDQKGLHSWVEEDVVDELFIGGGQRLEADVMTAAEKKWRKFASKWSNLSTLSLSEELAKNSNQALSAILKIDKKYGRKDLKSVAKRYRPILVDQLAMGTVALATLWSKEIGWPYDGKKFYAFSGEPAWIAYPTPTPPPGP